MLTVDDNEIIRIGLRAALEGLDGVDRVLDTADPDEARRLVEDGAVDVVLLDVQMPQTSGLDLLPRLAARVPVVMLTHRDDAETLRMAMGAGASGYLVHGALGPAQMADAIRVAVGGSAVVAGAAPRWDVRPHEDTDGRDAVSAAAAHAGLSERETSVMVAIAEGLGNAEIAGSLFLAPKTVKNNVNRIFAKLGVRTRPQAILRWQDLLRASAPTSPPCQAPPIRGPSRGPQALGADPRRG
ncbi:response regulator transcription factor [Xylanimonas ulmi]